MIFLKKETGLIAIDLKLEVKKLLDNSNLNVITLVPDVYIDNLTSPWNIPLITEQGILPYPIKNEQKIPWISHTDLAKFIVSAINKPQLAGQTLPIGGKLLTGEEIGTAISEKLGEKIQFVGLTPDEFQKNISPIFGELAGKEISNLYRYLDQNINQINDKNFINTQEVLGIKPQSLKEWINQVKWN